MKRKVYAFVLAAVVLLLAGCEKSILSDEMGSNESDGIEGNVVLRLSVYQQEDFASLGGLTKANGGSDYKYSNLSYEECADIIRKYTKAAPVEVLKFFRIVVFNYLILNDDAHLKNFSLMNRGNGEYHLTPAYDLINTSLHLYEPRIFALDKGLFREGMQFSDTHTVSRKDFEEFGRRIGLSPRLVNRELDFFATEHPLAQELISRSFLSEQLKRYYWQSYNYRRTTLTSY